jgi:3-oxoacyl-[acyl-carrier protein] reductase
MNWNKSKVIVISGGSRGLGQALTENLLENGYGVATFSRAKSAFIETMEDAGGENFFWRQLDIRNHAGVKDFVTAIYRRYGSICGLVNNAGATLDNLLPVTTDRQIDDTIFLNFQSTVLLSKYVSRAMLGKGSGSIVNISSVLGVRGFKGASVYSATKAALDGFSRSLARELGAKGIRVNSVAPGFLATDMTRDMPELKKQQIIRRTPLGRLGRVEDVTGVVRFLFSDAASFITGQTFVIDGGLTC